MPPPSTRSSSPIPVGWGTLDCGSTSPIGWTGLDDGAITGAVDADANSSTSVFHCPHDEHCPDHLWCEAPQSVQTYSTRVLAMVTA